ncbi:hypothetical protein AnigIFM60653_005917 [Aspergillus niger]|nr:hypothetical protein AnigIFM49718_008498 [Aspergillus niger]GLA05429.1 hypothetical protein AnigIFM60653_005917 [Aspergillus niger]
MSPAIPVIDLHHREDRQRLTDEIRHACEDLGFFQLRNYTIPDKDSFNRGYERFRAQKLEKRTTGDLKEGFFLGRHLPLDDPDGQTRSSSETRVDRYYGAVLSLTIDLMTVIAEIVGLDSDALRRFCTKPIATLHLLHYPPQAPDASELERGIGAHSDFGAITILLQDSVGGSTGLGPDIE